jgi:hypothetical protein
MSRDFDPRFLVQKQSDLASCLKVFFVNLINNEQCEYSNHKLYVTWSCLLYEDDLATLVLNFIWYLKLKVPLAAIHNHGHLVMRIVSPWCLYI